MICAPTNDNVFSFSHCFTKNVAKNDFQSHQHNHYEILFVTNGSGIFLVEDTAYEISGNTILLIPPKQYHVLKIPPQHNYERYILYFEPEFLPDLLKVSRPIVRQADENLLSFFRKSDFYEKEFTGEPLQILQKALLLEIMVNLCLRKDIPALKKAAFPELVQEAIHYICENLDKPLNTANIADALFISKTYLTHIFARTMNIPLMHYVRMKKMHRAREYLRQGNSVTRTAELLGYESYHTFLRNYSAEFGSLPSQEKHPLSDFV